MIVWMFVLDSRQVGNVGNCEPQTQWLSVNARLGTLRLNFPVYWFEIFPNVIQNLFSQNYVNLLHVYCTQKSVEKIIWKVIKKNFSFVSEWFDLTFT